MDLSLPWALRAGGADPDLELERFGGYRPVLAVDLKQICCVRVRVMHKTEN